MFKNWKDAEAMLAKKRENKAKLELARKSDKIPQASQEIAEVGVGLLHHVVYGCQK